MKDVTPVPKAGPKTKTRKGGRARPDEPLSLRCEVRFDLNDDPILCPNRPAQRHHKARRWHGDDSPENTLDVCNDHHTLIHANVRWAESHDYLRRSGGNPT